AFRAAPWSAASVRRQAVMHRSRFLGSFSTRISIPSSRFIPPTSWREEMALKSNANRLGLSSWRTICLRIGGLPRYFSGIRRRHQPLHRGLSRNEAHNDRVERQGCVIRKPNAMGEGFSASGDEVRSHRIAGVVVTVHRDLTPGLEPAHLHAEPVGRTHMSLVHDFCSHPRRSHARDERDVLEGPAPKVNLKDRTKAKPGSCHFFLL